VKESGVRILDHHPALELLVDGDGTVCGAAGVKEPDNTPWVVRTGAVVLASGGCAFLSKALGTNVLTGDGHLMAAEAGAAFSGMEFSNAYGLGPAFSSVTKSLFYNWATFRYADGREIAGAGSSRGRSIIARTLIERPVFAVLDKADAQIQRWMRSAQPNFFLPFDRGGYNPFADAFPITLRLEGTVRGTGGVELRSDTCATRVAGLYAAGDVATRELICGAFTGGGSHNAAWALSSGFWAGAGAADFARQLGTATLAQRPAKRTGGVGLHGRGARTIDPRAATEAVQAEVFPLQRNWFRSGDDLQASLRRLDALWVLLRTAAPSPRALARRTREAVAMLATARWMYRSALARTETRGMHRRDDHPALDPRQQHHVLSGGLHEVWVDTQAAAHPIAAAPLLETEEAAA
jgi:succinate dehydrogenase/fumarate reductase flavoprotein subunit